MDYTAVGQTTHLAARMEQRAMAQREKSTKAIGVGPPFGLPRQCPRRSRTSDGRGAARPGSSSDRRDELATVTRDRTRILVSRDRAGGSALRVPQLVACRPRLIGWR